MVFRDSNYKILEKAVINLENLSEDSNIGVVISELEKKRIYKVRKSPS